MLKIRLMRIGAKKKPFYRVVVLDERSKRTGAYIELLGTYNPLTQPKDIKLKQDRIDHWIKQGAQLSVGFLRVIGKAQQRPPRKAKKPARNAPQSDAGGEKKEEKPSAINPQPSDKDKEVQKQESVEGIVGEKTKSNEAAIASEAKQSSQDQDQTQIATEPEAPRDDKIEESEIKNERPS